MYTADAWVLRSGDSMGGATDSLIRKAIEFGEIKDSEVLVEPLFGSWEGNMTHAIERSPIDICVARGEPEVVLGNSGVVRVLKCGRDVTGLSEGDNCLFFGATKCDRYGYVELAHAYDAPNTIGLLAKRTKVAANNLFPIPDDSRFTLQQWAAFSIRYLTAWSNWRVAYGCLRLQMNEAALPVPLVWGWGGGTTVAELDLARHFGCEPTLVAGNKARQHEAQALGLEIVDRRLLADLNYDENKYYTDADYKMAYNAAEKKFIEIVQERTRHAGVSIFVDYIGSPVQRASLRGLARQGVITTAGWKLGMKTTFLRASECIRRHIHVHTHSACYSEVREAMVFAEANNWMPTVTVEYDFDSIPELVSAYANGSLSSYFPVYSVNSV
ncbi:zinc-binding dehydrogenase [Pseudomonas agarici]|uniref:zinc-binding dehydrogenase n=1 Tax=Pseudomonas agarici TaxID=46677 RepID=UPI0002D30DDF|nr:zinc-binding dehydrogenase [Pseudomonas agarici]NWC07667.1 zinc-binding dehydrogenase [Pseudomonas agarici]SEL04234.1 NADPH:quinone reductase [Pseudomonas agarici]